MIDALEVSKLLGGEAGYVPPTDPAAGWREDATDAVRLIAVKVALDGGAAGSDSERCGFTYTVRDLDDRVLAQSVAPQRARWTNTTYLPAGSGGRSEWALAAWDGVTLTLLECYGEIQSNAPCET